jgi:hypothetical protein
MFVFISCHAAVVDGFGHMGNGMPRSVTANRNRSYRANVHRLPQPQNVPTAHQLRGSNCLACQPENSGAHSSFGAESRSTGAVWSCQFWDCRPVRTRRCSRASLFHREGERRVNACFCPAAGRAATASHAPCQAACASLPLPRAGSQHSKSFFNVVLQH